jgi:tRNA A-37 threonylcarbamoyl transferase component Bud32
MPADRGWVRYNPAHRVRLERIGLSESGQFCDLPGPVVSGHPDRHVRRVEIGEITAFLKVEHRVPWRDRLRHALAGGGWVSKSEREADLLDAAATAGLPAPEWLAYGEDGRGRAFLLVAAIVDGVELRQALLDSEKRRALAKRVGRALGRLHTAGFDHPDLHAKHVLISPAAGVVLLDWQNVRRCPSVTRQRRARALAWLDATLADRLMSLRERALFLRSYLRAASIPAPRKQERDFAAAVRRHTARLLRRRAVQEARKPPLATGAQQLVWVDGEAICAIPEIARELAQPDWRHLLYAGVDSEARRVTLADGRPARLVRRWRPAVLRIPSWLRGRAWRADELRQAGLLFHLQRHGVSCVRLLAFGQRLTTFGPARSFLLTEEPADAAPLGDCVARRPRDADAALSLASALLDELHAARCHFAGPAVASTIWIRSNPLTATIGRVAGLRLARQPLSRRLIERDCLALVRLRKEVGR